MKYFDLKSFQNYGKYVAVINCDDMTNIEFKIPGNWYIEFDITEPLRPCPNSPEYQMITEIMDNFAEQNNVQFDEYQRLFIMQVYSEHYNNLNDAKL